MLYDSMRISVVFKVHTKIIPDYYMITIWHAINQYTLEVYFVSTEKFSLLQKDAWINQI